MPPMPDVLEGKGCQFSGNTQDLMEDRRREEPRKEGKRRHKTGFCQKIARLCTIMHDWIRFGRARGTGGAHLGITTIGGNEPLSPAFAKATAGRLALSPLRGARELAYRLVVIARCARTGAHSTFLGGFFLIFSPNLRGAAGLRLGLRLGLGGEPIKVKCTRGTVASGKRRARERTRPCHFLSLFAISSQKNIFFYLYPPLSTFIDLYPACLALVWRKPALTSQLGRGIPANPRPPAARRTI